MLVEWKPPTVHIHQLPHGKSVRTISHQELGLNEKDELKGVNFSGQLLHLAVGYGYTKSLHSYKVKGNLPKLIHYVLRGQSAKKKLSTNLSRGSIRKDNVLVRCKFYRTAAPFCWEK